jgi:hypothetical protein
MPSDDFHICLKNDSPALLPAQGGLIKRTHTQVVGEACEQVWDKLRVELMAQNKRRK